MFHPTFLAQKVRIQHIIVCEAKAGTVEVPCKNNTPLIHCSWRCAFEPRNEPKITFARHMRRRYSAQGLSSPRFRLVMCHGDKFMFVGGVPVFQNIVDVGMSRYKTELLSRWANLKSSLLIAQPELYHNYHR